MTRLVHKVAGILTLSFISIGVLAVSSLPSNAQGIELILTDRIPIPELNPKRGDHQSNQSNSGQSKDVEVTKQVRTTHSNIPPIRGTLEQGLEAIAKNDGLRALAIRAGMPAGSLDRKILAWSIALSGNKSVSSATIAKITADLPNWPGQNTMRRNAERAVAREATSPHVLINAFGNSKPESIEGATALAWAFLQRGDTRAANRVIAPFWRSEKLDKKTEAKVLEKAGAALSREDHRVRMHTLFYNDRITAAQRIQSKAEQVSLGKARAAAIRNSANAKSLILDVAPSSKKDPGYLFARIERARRAQDFDFAAKLLMQAPSSEKAMIDTGEWWVERRIASRKMQEVGKYKLAYRLAAQHASTEAKDVIEAEFHAGWYALRFLKDASTARKHFANILRIAKRPLSRSRGYYWMGRASRGKEAQSNFRQAANYPGTFYGQLAARELGTKSLSISRPTPSKTDRNNFSSRELARAIVRLENTKYAWRAKSMYRYLARTLNSTGELALLAARAEKRGDYNLSLQVGKIAYGRGFDVDTLSWPLGAIPSGTKIRNTGKALAYSIARQESAFDRAAVSPANARGLLQLLPGTAKGVARRLGLSYSYKKLTRDAGYNATLGAAYLSEQLENFGNSYILTFAAYNAGPNRVREWIERFGDPRGRKLYDVIDWIEQIPFSETRHYVQRIMENYQVYKTRIGGSSLNIEEDLVRGRR